MLTGLSSFLLILFLKATLVLAVAGLGYAAFRRMSAASRHALLCGTAVALLVLPALAWIVPGWRPPTPAVVARTIQNAKLVVTVHPSQRTSVSWTAVAAGIWASGVVLLLLRVGLQHVRRARAVAGSLPFPGDLPGNIRLAPGLPVPMVCGVVAPTILLPEEALEWPEDRMAAVLAHETSHVVRKDTLWLAVSQIVKAIYWVHPCAWMLDTWLRHEAELACDDTVLLRGLQPSEYAQHLLEIIRELPRKGAVIEGGIAMARFQDIEPRLRALFQTSADRRPVSRRFATGAAAFLSLLLIPTAAFQLSAFQPNGISGVIRDASGAAVPKAEVVVNFTGTHRKEFTRANEVGEFQLGPLPDGTYEVQVKQPGFALSSTSGIVIENGQGRRIEVVLNTGRVMETVNVVGERPAGMAAAPVSSGSPQRIRVGGNVQAVKLVSKTSPVYPPDCKAEKVEGSVLLSAVISKTGDSMSIEPINQLVDQRLTQAALDAVKLWRWEPTLLNGNPVEVSTEIQINFTLK